MGQRSERSIRHSAFGKVDSLMKLSSANLADRTGRRTSRDERRGFMLWIVAAMVALGSLGGWWFFGRQAPGEGDTKIVLHEVKREDFKLEVTERGEIESAGVTEVVSEVKTKNTPGVSILRIVPEG